MYTAGNVCSILRLYKKCRLRFDIDLRAVVKYYRPTHFYGHYIIIIIIITQSNDKRGRNVNVKAWQHIQLSRVDVAEFREV